MKLIHHHKMEAECDYERFSLIKLVGKFKTTLKSIEKNSNLDLTNNAEYDELKKFYNETEAKLIDPDVFFSVLGDNFEAECPDVEYIDPIDKPFEEEQLEE